jgi:hypothetical protein
MTIATGLPINDIESWNGISFTVGGLHSLEPEGWLCNHAIDLFAILDCQTSDRVSYIPSNSYSFYRAGVEDGNPNPNVYSKSAAHASQMLACPVWMSIINHGNNHWQVLCIVNHGTPSCMALLMDSLAPSSNLTMVQNFATAFIQAVYHAANQPLLSTSIPKMAQCKVQRQPNGHDCGTFALLNLKNAVFHLDDMLALQPTSQCEQFNFLWWYHDLMAVHYRSYLYQRYTELLDACS